MFVCEKCHYERHAVWCEQGKVFSAWVDSIVIGGGI